MRNKRFYFSIFFVLLFTLSFASATKEYVDLGGRWRSSTGNTFYILTTQEGFKYQNTKTKTWFYANWQNDYDDHKYEAPNFKKANGSKYSIYFTVKDKNTMSVYNSGSGVNNTWVRIVE